MAEHNTQSDDTFKNKLIEGNERESTIGVAEPGAFTARCPVCHQVIGATAGDAEHGNFTDVAEHGSFTDVAEPVTASDNAEAGTVTDAQPCSVTGNAEPARCSVCHQVLLVTADTVRAGAETGGDAAVGGTGGDAAVGGTGGDTAVGASGGEAETTIVPRQSVVYFNRRRDDRFQVNLASPGERFCGAPNPLIAEGGRYRQVPGDALPQRIQPGDAHVVVRREEAIEQEDERQVERQRRSLEERRDPSRRRSLIHTFYESSLKVKIYMILLFSLLVLMLVTIITIVIIFLVNFLSADTGTTRNDTGDPRNDTDDTGTGSPPRRSRIQVDKRW